METDFSAIIIDLCIIIFCWLLIFTSCFGWGALWSRIFKFRFSDEDRPFIYCWLGFIFVLVAFSLLNLFIPIDYVSSSIFFGAGFVFSYKFKKEFSLPNTLWKYIVFAFCALLISVVAVQLPYCYDTGLYHFNSIRWLNEYAVVPGLGNLHHRLGFNQLIFYWNAALNFHPFFNDYAFHLSNSFLYFLLVSSLIFAENKLSKLFLALLWTIPVSSLWISSPSPDVAAAVIQIALFYYFIKINREKDIDVPSYVGFSALLGAVSSLVKLSSSLFAVGLGIIALIYALNNKSKFIGTHCRGKAVAVFIFLLAVIWFAKGYIATGYPMFPAAFGRINFDWAVPEEMAKYASKCVFCFARTHGYDFNSPLLKDMNWIKPWFFRELTDSSIILYLGFVLFSCICFFIWFLVNMHKKGVFQGKFYCLVWLVVFISLIFWFIQAPDFRFSNGLFLICFINSVLLLQSVFFKIKAFRLFDNYCVALAILVSLFDFCMYVDENVFYLSGMMKLHKVPMRKVIVNKDLTVFMPVLSDQPFDSELPATPELSPHLKLRKKSIAEGFSVSKS